MKRLTDEAYNNARRLLKKHEDKLHTLATALIEKETLTGQEVGGWGRGSRNCRVSAEEAATFVRACVRVCTRACVPGTGVVCANCGVSLPDVVIAYRNRVSRMYH